MRALIGWMAAMLASALLGAVVYENVLSKPVPASEQTATVEAVPEDSAADTDRVPDRGQDRGRANSHGNRGGRGRRP